MICLKHLKRLRISRNRSARDVGVMILKWFISAKIAEKHECILYQIHILKRSEEMKQSQCENILHHMKLHGSITEMEALNRYGCFRLASRINDLKRQGYIIQAKAIKTATGKTISEYSMADHQTNLFEA